MEARIEIRLITINKQPVKEDHVEEFIELLEADRMLPAITVRKITDDEYRLVDGRHRLEARLRLGQTRVCARVTL
jgi:ParB-like chromosome segregation protein Spo0J